MSNSNSFKESPPAIAVPLGNVVVHQLSSGINLTEEIPATTDADNSYDDNFAENLSTYRYTMRMIESALPENSSKSTLWNGAALVVGQNPAAHALCNQLTSQGVSVESLPISEDIDETLATFEKIWRERPTPHLFLTSARDPQPSSPNDEHDWRRRQDQTVLLSYLLCQRWIQLASEANLLKQCTLVGLTSLGGDFGFSGNVKSPESGANHRAAESYLH